MYNQLHLMLQCNKLHNILVSEPYASQFQKLFRYKFLTKMESTFVFAFLCFIILQVKNVTNVQEP